MALVAFNESATMLGQPTADKNALRAALDTLEPSYSGTRYYEAFTLADRVFSQMASAQRQLVIVSDFQRNGWNRSSRESVIGSDVKAEYVNLAVENPTNVGIDSVSVEPAVSFARTYTGRVIARIHNHRKDQPVTVPISVSINGKEATRKTIMVAPNGTTLAEFTGFDLPIGFSKGRVRIEADDPLKLDNDFLFALDRREKLSVLVVDAGRARQSFFLRQAYTSSPDLPYAVNVTPLQNITPEELGKHDVVVLNDVPRLPDRIRDRLDELRKTGQGQLVILGENADTGWWNSYAKLPAKTTQKIFVAKDRGRSSVALTTYDHNHSIFKPFETSTKLALNSAQFFAYVGMEARPGATVLAKFEDGSPVIIESAKEDHGMLVSIRQSTTSGMICR
jgi:von Willebrand factor type A domain